MRILAIDSSGLVASAAVATEDVVLAEYTTNYKKTHSQTLLPMIEEIIAMTETELSGLAAIAVTAGPGSFTGLRIGSATAKGLGQALGIPLISVPTTLALAWNFAGSSSIICPLMDARRSQVYTGLYRWKEETREMESLTGQLAVPVEEMLAKINELGSPVVYLGDGMDAYREVLCAKTKVPYLMALPHQSRQRAASVAAGAFSYLRQGNSLTKLVKCTRENEVCLMSAAAFAPVYLRKSQAEREREEAAGINKMCPEDIKTVALFEKNYFSQPWSEASLTMALENSNYLLFVYKEQREILGYCGLLCMGVEAELVFVCVREDARRKGIAGQMLGACMEAGKQRGVEDVFLEVRVRNHPARCLYKKLGFEEVGCRKDYYEKPKEDAVLMRIHLEKQ